MFGRDHLLSARIKEKILNGLLKAPLLAGSLGLRWGSEDPTPDVDVPYTVPPRCRIHDIFFYRRSTRERLAQLEYLT